MAKQEVGKQSDIQERDAQKKLALAVRGVCQNCKCTDYLHCNIVVSVPDANERGLIVIAQTTCVWIDKAHTMCSACFMLSRDPVPKYILIRSRFIAAHVNHCCIEE